MTQQQPTTARLDDAAVQDFMLRLRGDLIRPGDAGYDDARKVYNGMIDKRPALIAQCVDVADVIGAVNFARAHNLTLAVRGGGHNGAGLASCDGGLVIDLSRMKGIHVDPAARTVRVEGGCTWGDVDHATHPFGLATPSGFVSTTGVGGLTLGGGIGYLSRTHGLTIDNLLGVDMVLADGSFVTASDDENSDLFWAVRGGGANVGIVTSFEYQLHQVGPVIGGGIVFSAAKARRVLAFYDELARGCPDDLSVNAALATAEDGTAVVGIAVGWCGALDVGERILKPLRTFETPIVDTIAPMRYVDLQGGGDAAFPRGRRHYWKAGFKRRLEAAAIDTMIDFAARRPSPFTRIGLQQMHGAAARVSPTATAFAHRRDQWDFMALSQWEHADDDERNIRWTRELYAAMEPYLEHAVYVNDLSEDESDRVREAYGANYERLAAVKATYDPTNFFRGNQNVATAAAVTGQAR